MGCEEHPRSPHSLNDSGAVKSSREGNLFLDVLSPDFDLFRRYLYCKDDAPSFSC